PSCATEHLLVNARKARLPETLRQLIDPLLKTLEVVDSQLNTVEAELGTLCAQEPIIAHLCTAPGVGPIMAASFVAVVDDAQRFHRAHQLESYLGLVPSEDSSGGRRRVGAISKKGNSYLRALLVQAAWNVLRKSERADPLRQWGEAVAERRGKRIAVVAIARRLAGILFAMWRHGTVYDPLALGRKTARGLRSQAEDIKFRAEALERVAHKRSCRLLKQEVKQPR